MAGIETALVIGGGIAGPAAAVALRRAGVEAAVYEAYPSTADGVGGTLAIAPNGLAALDAVGVHDAVAAIGTPIERSVMSFGRRAVALPRLEGLPPMRVLDRARLSRVLHDRAQALGVPVVPGKRLVDAVESADGVTARFADGSTATADVLIGADGVHSTVRRLIDPQAPGPRHTGLVGLESEVDLELPEGPGGMTFAFGSQAYYLYWTLPGGRVGWGANLPHRRPLSLTEARRVPPEQWLATLREVYGGDSPGGELVRRTRPEKLHVVGSTHIMPSVPRWHRGRMVLVGDAVHAPSNSSGQGASLAVESALQLARCLRDLPDFGSAFAAYERLRRPRVERIAARAARINQVKAPGRLTRAMMPLAMRLLSATAMRPERTFGPEQRHRIDFDAPVEPGAGAARPTG
ncbi:FAD-dependent oxidoreductase [Allonocardiopsis opalescens]|uniref:2-polyprenyl-6-methoxyphenol hydroxylase-like FAD-dependent oxidoreductase n=1 Tax=Allonocardiopsis opalescens TaxID=1144618 RepID=A0A2T0Q1M1_9ACTN|nr:FAD-dependent monooxygenase [Allonocardiopsis opalescens]PRX97694.1 2-polyprenyl-6-methoxyphenol hydroxylase-like FAD-dependent oxidoreductase [Allonocardiopsis opalescens]